MKTKVIKVCSPSLMEVNVHYPYGHRKRNYLLAYCFMINPDKSDKLKLVVEKLMQLDGRDDYSIGVYHEHKKNFPVSELDNEDTMFNIVFDDDSDYYNGETYEAIVEDFYKFVENNK